MLAHSSHRWSATGLQRGTTLPGAPAESALASAFLEPAGQNAAGATRLAKVCPSASSNPRAPRAGLARLSVPRGRSRAAAHHPVLARAADRLLSLALLAGATLFPHRPPRR